jgi:hypothetical protein
MIKMPNCRPQYFFNYFNQNSDSQNDERILDIESSIGHMNLYYMNKISGKNLDEYFDILGQKCIHKFQNSLLTGNFGALKISCDDNNPNTIVSKKLITNNILVISIIIDLTLYFAFLIFNI